MWQVFFSEVARQWPVIVFKKYSIKGVSQVVFQIFQKRYFQETRDALLLYLIRSLDLYVT